MNKGKKSLPEATGRRRRAKEQVTGIPVPPLSEPDTRQPQHKIQVHRTGPGLQDEARYRFITETLPDIIFQIDLEGRITYCSPAVVQVLGFTPNEVIGTHFMHYFPMDRLARATEGLERAAAAQRIEIGETELLSRAGTRVVVEVRLVPLVHDGQVVGIQGIARDITERKRAEGALRASDERLKTILRTALDGFWLVDQQGCLTEVNEAYARMSGYSEQELRTMSIHDLEAVERPAETAAHIQRVMMQGEDRFETRHRRRDGSVFDVEVSAQYRPFEGVQFIAFLRDITARKQAAEELQKHRDHLEQLVTERTAALQQEVAERRRTEDALRASEEMLRQRNKELTALNEIAAILNRSAALEQTLGAVLERVLSLAEATGGWVLLLDSARGTLALVAQRGIPPEMALTDDFLALEEGVNVQAVRRGKTIVLEDATTASWFATGRHEEAGLNMIAAAPLKLQDRVLGVLGLFRCGPGWPPPWDASLLTAIGRQVGVAVENAYLVRETSEIEVLRQVDRLRAELIANVSHELRTPLGLIKASSTLLLMDDVELDRATQHEFLYSIDEETERLETIVDNLLDIARDEGGQLHPNRRLTDLTELIQTVLAGMEPQLTRHRLREELPDGPLEAVADRHQVQQVLRNLLDNAIKYSPTGGTITVRGRRGEGEVLVQIEDQGIGIPAECLKRVFDRFYRVEGEITRQVRGVGLGLAICKGIVEAHGGHIWVTSKPGAGSTFFFTLPVGE